MRSSDITRKVCQGFLPPGNFKKMQTLLYSSCEKADHVIEYRNVIEAIDQQ